MLDGILALFSNIAMSFVHFFYAVTHPWEWLGWLSELGQLETTEAKQALGRFIFYGAVHQRLR